ncbi:MAG: ribosome-associated translation inhibitor RaiA [Bacillota bacterium]|jgi:putative sigma-54 modulation protein
MKMDLTARNLEIGDDLRRYIEKKVRKFAKYFDGSAPAQVVLKNEKGRQIVEITLPIDGMFVRGEEATNDIYASVNMAVEKIERQIEKYRTRFLRRKREGRAQVRSLPTAPSPDEEEPRLVRVKRFNIKPMPAEEAILQMNLLGHDFYVFMNSETEQVSVVYRRRDGNYGLIEPE